MPIKSFALATLLMPFLVWAEAEVDSSSSFDAPELRIQLSEQTDPVRTVLQVAVKSEEAVKQVSAHFLRARSSSTEQSPWDYWTVMAEKAAGDFELSYPSKAEPLEIVVFVWTDTTGHRYTFAPGSAEPKTIVSKSKQEWEPAPRKPPESEPKREPSVRSGNQSGNLSLHLRRRAAGSAQSVQGMGSQHPKDPRAQALADRLAAQKGGSLQGRLNAAVEASPWLGGPSAVGEGATDTQALEELKRKTSGFTPRAYARQESGGKVIWVAIP